MTLIVAGLGYKIRELSGAEIKLQKKELPQDKPAKYSKEETS